MNCGKILSQVVAGKRLTEDEFLFLYQNAELLDLGQAATEVRDRLFPEGRITFIIDRNINYTNICQCQCRFCAFYRNTGHPEAYVLSWEEIRKKIKEAEEMGASQIMLQGGLNPALAIEYFEDLFARIKEEFPGITIHSLSPPEIEHIARISGITIREALARLKKAGLSSLPGGGAEILDDEVRTRISPRKINTSTWLQVMEEAHLLGLKSTATMMLGSVDEVKHRLNHMSRVRSLQDKTGGFRAFIMWSYQPGNNELMGFKISSTEYLRMLALARLYLDNFQHIQGSWVTQGPQVGQLSLYFGADDLGSTMLEENVVRAAGVGHSMSVDQMVNLIRETGKIPALRNTEYDVVKEFK